MSKRQAAPAAPVRRLVVAGGAKARTNAGGGSKIDEDVPLRPYDA